MAEIAASQRLERNLRRQLAARNLYRHAKYLQTVSGTLAALLALGSPLVLYFWPLLGPTLGAIAGLWIFISRLVVRPARDRRRHLGAAAQEAFDVDVLGLASNPSLGVQISEEEIRRASGASSNFDGVTHWYPTEQPAAWPLSVLTCQRANAVWARRQHYSYSVLLLCTAGLWFLIGVAVAILSGATLVLYLAAIAMPSLPALLDATDLAREHKSASEDRERLETRVNALIETLEGVSEVELREVQDQILMLRRLAPLVPEWFYTMIARKYEREMQYAAERLAERGRTYGNDD